MIFKSRSHSVDLSVGSTADIAFLLLIFFVLVTTISSDKGLGLTLPPPGEEMRVPPGQLLTLFVNYKDEILLGDDRVNIESLPDELESRFRMNQKLVVSIKAGRGSTYDKFVQVLEAVKKSGVRKISLAEPDASGR